MRRPKPYYKKSHHAWYVNLNGRPKRLASEAEGEKAAYKEYDSLMAGRQPTNGNLRVGELVQRFLNHHAGHSAKGTHDFYHLALASFLDCIGPNLRVSDLRVYHVTDWIDRYHKTVKKAKKVDGRYTVEDTGRPISSNYHHNLIRAVKAAFRWAEDQEYIEQSPIRKAKLPQTESRGDDAYLTTEQWGKVVAAVARANDGGALLEFITIMHETGCRPQEARSVESRHFDRAGRCWIFPRKEAKGKRDPRVVHLNNRAFDLCQRLALKYPDGPLFRNRVGKGWKHRMLDHRLNRLSKKLGFPVTLYSIRHTFCTDCLAKGMDVQTLAIIMGHRDLKMISRVYQHLGKRADHVKEALRKATG